MTKKKLATTTKVDRPVLISCGSHYVNPDEIAKIRYMAEKDLFLVDFKQKPDPSVGFWLNEEEAQNLINYFNVIGA